VVSTAGDGHVLHCAVSNLSLIALDCLFFLPDVRKGGRMWALLDIKICVDSDDRAMHLVRTCPCVYISSASQRRLCRSGIL